MIERADFCFRYCVKGAVMDETYVELKCVNQTIDGDSVKVSKDALKRFKYDIEKVRNIRQPIAKACMLVYYGDLNIAYKELNGKYPLNEIHVLKYDGNGMQDIGYLYDKRSDEEFVNMFILYYEP